MDKTDDSAVVIDLRKILTKEAYEKRQIDMGPILIHGPYPLTPEVDSEVSELIHAAVMKLVEFYFGMPVREDGSKPVALNKHGFTYDS